MMELPPVRPPALLDLSFVRRGGETRIDRRRFRWPFVLTGSFVLDGDPPYLRSVILQSSSGAMTGDDRLSQRIVVAEGAAAHVSTQAATVVHRADPGPGSSERIDLQVAGGGYLEFLPDPRILFPGAALTQRLDLTLAPGGAAIISDSFALHRPSGAEAAPVRYRSDITLRRPVGRPLVLDRQRLPDPPPAETCHAGLYILWPGADAQAAEVSASLSRALAAVPGLYGAASPLPHGMGVGLRLVSRDARALRRGMDLSWSAGRARILGRAPGPGRTGEKRHPAEPG
ncbi:urease accessory protein UreD [Marinibacterium profundimaris]|uniref:urease accessory protein UreD n=1 Tax=Marinibacterium profundimaris TaxID=1679460 RepID=UPI000B51FB32|nr:urease accessory protein UreD [Marinibacterium profundimaris]